MIRALLILLVLLPQSVFAQSAAVTSGEHPHFSRLVIDLGKPHFWEAEQDNAHLTINITSFTRPFDLSDAFTRIPRTRIRALDPSVSGTLKITLGCACKTQTFLFQNQFLVIDVGDPKHALPNVAGVQPAQVLSPKARPRASPLPLFIDRHPKDPPDALAGLMRAGFEIARIAAQDPSDHLAITSPHTIDPKMEVNPPDPNPISVQRCRAQPEDSLASWAGPEPFSTMLAKLRSATVDETGRLQKDAQATLVRFFISQGMGHEALDLLATSDDPEMPRLRAMASLLADRMNIPAGALDACPQDLIWAILQAQKRGQALRSLDSTQVMRVYRDLSDPLKVLFTKPLLRYLEAHGHAQAHADLIALTERLAPAKTHPEPAPDEPLSTTENPELQVVETLIERFRSIEAGAQAPAADRALIPTFVTEYRGTHYAEPLWAAQVRMLLLETRFPDALDVLLTGQTRFPDSFAEVYEESIAYLADTADDISFLRFALLQEADPALWPKLSTETASKVTTRLTELGF